MGIRKGDSVKALRVWRRWGTPEDRREWAASPDSKGMTDDGETKLPPMAVYRYGTPSDPITGLKVVKGRAKSCWTSYALGAPSGCALLMDADGVEWFAFRKGLRHA